MDKEVNKVEDGPQPGPEGISQEAIERLLGRKELALLMMSEKIASLQEQVRNLLAQRAPGQVLDINKRV